MIKLPKMIYFIPFYNVYLIINRIRKIENLLALTKHDQAQLSVQLDGLDQAINKMKNDSYKEVQFYEARIENIYQNIMSKIDLDPSDAKL